MTKRGIAFEPPGRVPEVIGPPGRELGQNGVHDELYVSTLDDEADTAGGKSRPA